MFGSKTRKAQRLGEQIGARLKDILAFPRWSNGGKVPETLRNDHYVLGYHFMMCLNLYIESKAGRTDPLEQGLVLTRALPLALDRETSDLSADLEDQMANPDEAFKCGTEDANRAYQKLLSGDTTAFEDFSIKIRSKYQS